MPVEAFEQTFGLLESSLPNAQVREPQQREELGRPVARLEGPDRRQQLALRLFPAAECDQNPAVVRPAGRRHEVAPRLEASRGAEPLLGPSHVGRPFAGAQQPAVDLAGGTDTDDLSRGDRGHRLVDQPHPFGDTPRGDVRLAEQRHRIELEVPIAIAPGDRDRRRREPLALRCIGGPRSAIEHQPPVRSTLFDSLQQALRPRHPPVGGRHVAVDRHMQERQPARQPRGLRPQATPLVSGKRPLLELDRPPMLAPELQRLSQAIENLSALAQLRRLLEYRPGALPVRDAKRLAAEAYELVSPRHTHRRPCSHARAVGLPRKRWRVVQERCRPGRAGGGSR